MQHPTSTRPALFPSMKVPPKRKGNATIHRAQGATVALNESPSEKEGKFLTAGGYRTCAHSLNESPSEKEGKCAAIEQPPYRKYIPQ